MSNRHLLEMNNKAATTLWKLSALVSSSFVAPSLTSNRYPLAGVAADLTISSKKVSIALRICFFIPMVTLPFLKFTFIPRKSWMSPLVVDISPNFPSIHPITLSTTSDFLWLILLSSTYQQIVHWLPSMSAFATHESYGFNTKPNDSKVLVYSSYHNNALFTHP